MANYVQQLIDIENNNIFPITASAAVLTGVDQTLNDTLGTMSSSLENKQEKLKLWTLRLTDLTIQDNGQLNVCCVYNPNTSADGLIITPIPTGATIINAYIVRYDGYRSALSASINPATGYFILHGLSSAKLKTLLNTTTESHYTITNITIGVLYYEG